MVYQHRRRQGPAGVAADPARRPDGPAGPTPIGLGTLTTRRSRRMRSAREERVRRHGGDADEPHADPPVVVTVKGAEVAGWSSLREAVNSPAWQFPAGMVKPAARSDAVAAAETLAETGVLCEPTRLVGSRVHPRTNVHCDYHLCRYIAGEARNLDPAENLGVLWVERAKVTALIPSDDIYLPVLDELIPAGFLKR